MEQKKFYRKPAPAAPSKLVELGKLPPQAIDLEVAVLGAIMLDSYCLNTIIDILRPEMFYKEAHQLIFEACVELYKKSEPVDILTVTQQLKALGKLEHVGGAFYVTQLTNRIASSANAELHARIVLEKYIRREIIQRTTSLLQGSYEEEKDIFELIDKTQNTINDTVSQVIKNKEQDARQLADKFIEHLKNAQRKEKEISGVPTTIAGLDRKTGGWQKTDLIIVAGRPGAGKTAFTKACIKGAINQLRRPVLMFSLEMSSLQVMARLISEDTNVTSQDYLSGAFKYNVPIDVPIEATKNYFDENGKPLLIIDDTASLTINELKARAKRVKAQYDICLIVIDYLQLITSINANNRSENRVAEVSTITRNLKILAKELDVPLIALSQLNREVEAQGSDMRPKLSHLRESGSIEQDADLVLFLFRPEYYAQQGVKRFELIELDGQNISSKGYAEAIIAKHRNGSVDTVRLLFTSEYTKFEDWRIPAGSIPEQMPL